MSKRGIDAYFFSRYHDIENFAGWSINVPLRFLSLKEKNSIFTIFGSYFSNANIPKIEQIKKRNWTVIDTLDNWWYLQLQVDLVLWLIFDWYSRQ